MINELLTCMETFEGIFIASTNLQEKLDKASARRFDFKVEFGYLRSEQVSTLFSDLVNALGIKSVSETNIKLGGLVAATPGDFANVLRQAQLVCDTSEPQRLVELLLREQVERQPNGGLRRMGFI